MRDATPLAPGGGESGDLVSDSSQLVAENDLLRQRVATAERDLDASKKEVEDERARVAAWQDAFGLHDGVDPKDKVRETVDALEAKTKRVTALQMALGIGDGDDPRSSPLHGLRGDEPSPGTHDIPLPGDLPPWGRLLLLTQLAKHHPSLGALYLSTPDVLQEANGDRWMAFRQETRGEDGTAGHVVIVQRISSTYAYAEAQTQKLHYEGELAVALRGRGAAERAAAANLSAAAKTAARDRLRDAKARVEEIQAALKEIEPRLVAPEPTEWRADAEGIGLV